MACLFPLTLELSTQEARSQQPPTAIELLPADTPPAFSPAETHPNAKRVASEVALALTRYEATDTPADIAGRLPMSSAQALEIAHVLHVPGAAARSRLVYPQLGGLTDDRISVMVLVEQQIALPDRILIAERTLDIRLRLSGGRWQFERLASAGGVPVPPPGTLSPEAEAVLSDPRIQLPDSARWDIYSGLISPNLLRVMARLAEITPYGVATLSEGHPYEVFGTPRQSDHTRGRAVDIYRIGDSFVIDDRAIGSYTYQIALWLLEQPEIRQIGGPWRIEGQPQGRSFTDIVHQDHLHLAVHP